MCVSDVDSMVITPKWLDVESEQEGERVKIFWWDFGKIMAQINRRDEEANYE